MADPNKPNPGGLWARLFGVNPPKKHAPHEGESAPTEPPLDLSAPLPPPFELHPEPPPDPSLQDSPEPPLDEVAQAIAELDTPPPAEAPSPRAPEPQPEPPAVQTPEPEAAPLWPSLDAAEPEAPPQLCSVCGTPRKGTQAYCDDCGWMFPTNGPPTGGTVSAVSTSSPGAAGLIRGRYELQELINERGGVQRYRGHDHATGQPVVIVRSATAEMAEALLMEEDVPVAEAAADDDLMPTFDAPIPVAKLESGPPFPSVAWELAILEKATNPALPELIENFVEDGSEYLIEEAPQGAVLWDAWLDPDVETADRYLWLMQVAQALSVLHRAGATIEGLRPDLVVVPNTRQARIADLSDLLPIPVPPGTPLRASLYTAPELIETPQDADGRSALYSLGATLYSLEYLGHPLEQKDFSARYEPIQITDRNPDVHPGFFRVLCKTFVKDVNTRFPTDEAGREDPSGLTELIRTLDVCRRTFDNVRLDIASWTTTGMVRTGNEDAFSLMHAVDARLDDCWEYALILLCDGMGGYEAGEVAAAMTIQVLKNYLLQQPPFAALAGKEVSPAAGGFDPESCKPLLREALRHANKEVYTAARAPGKGRRGMGCTAEIVYIDSRNLVVGHVGDSRVYHLTHGRLNQLTRDQTLVNRLVELGQLTAEEAEDHPRKNELQQAIGGQPDVLPGVYSAKLRRGDWVLVCSDGLTNHIPTPDLEKMMLREASDSADQTARRLINLVNLRGATDNATLVVIRAS